MSIYSDAVELLISDGELAHQWVHGDQTTSIQTENGPVRSLAKFIADNQAIINAIPPSLAGMQQTSQKDQAGGYVGLSGYAINVRNALGTAVSTISSLATSAHQYLLQDKNGTLAFLTDITGTNSGLNTGDETPAGLLLKLNIASISGVNTGDQTLEQLGGQPLLTYVPANQSSIGQPGGIAPLDSNALIPAIYLPSFVDDVLEFPTQMALPLVGETGKIYVTLDTNLTYRWSGSAYIELVSSPGTTDVVPEGSGNLYFTPDRVLATLLTGLNVALNIQIAPTDTVIQAFSKLQQQISSIVLNIVSYAPLSGASFTGPVSTTSAFTASVSVGSTGTVTAGTGIYVGQASNGGKLIYVDDTNTLRWTAGLLPAAGSKNYTFYDTVNNRLIYSVDATTGNVAVATGLTVAGSAVLTQSQVGVANGLVPLDGTAKIAALYLPSYVDDVLEVATVTALPVVGETGKIYVTLDTNFEYRWSGSVYIRLVASPGSTDAVPEGQNLYFTYQRVLATALTAITTQNSLIAIGDSIITSFGKLQGQISAALTSITALQTSVTKISFYDVSSGMGGKPAASDSAVAHVAIRPFTIAANAPLAQAVVGTAPAATFVYVLLKNGTAFATLTFAANATVGVIHVPSDTAFVAGDVMKISAQTPADSNISDLSFTFAAVLN